MKKSFVLFIALALLLLSFPCLAEGAKDAACVSYAVTEGNQLVCLMASSFDFSDEEMWALYERERTGETDFSKAPCCDAPSFSDAAYLYWHEIQKDGTCKLSMQAILVCENCRKIAGATARYPLAHNRGDGAYPGNCE